MTAKKKQRKTSKAVLQGVTIAALLGASGWLTVQMQHKSEDGKLPSLGTVAVAPTAGGAGKSASGKLTYSRLSDPARTVVRDGDGEVAATFTDGARTAVLSGPSRTFSEPRTTKAKVVTDSWVRLLPHAWQLGSQDQAWFKTWFKKYRDSKADDIFAIAMQYGDGAATQKNAQGLRYRGDAQFGPIDPTGVGAGDSRLEQSDFYDYLGVSWQFKDGTVSYPETAKLGAIDCSGFVRTVFGYRSGYPLLGKDVKGAGLPRTANGMATLGPGVPILALTPTGSSDPLYHFARPTAIDTLQPGDLVFFELDRRTGIRLDHTGIFLGLDTDGHPRYISSRQEANGPTMGDVGGTSRLDGNGFYAKWLRSAKRL
jgi:cell wall-associated NlpC family hydrolase